MSRPKVSTSIEAALVVFCSLHGIDPKSTDVREFFAVLLSEVSGALVGAEGVTDYYVKKYTNDQ